MSKDAKNQTVTFYCKALAEAVARKFAGTITPGKDEVGKATYTVVFEKRD